MLPKDEESMRTVSELYHEKCLFISSILPLVNSKKSEISTKSFKIPQKSSKISSLWGFSVSSQLLHQHIIARAYIYYDLYKHSIKKWKRRVWRKTKTFYFMKKKVKEKPEKWRRKFLPLSLLKQKNTRSHETYCYEI